LLCITTAVQISSEPAMGVLISRDIAPALTCFVKAGWQCHWCKVYGGAVQVIR
jgi:hypothetical protein